MSKLSDVDVEVQERLKGLGCMKIICFLSFIKTK